jgi:hypothetical protein
MKTRTKMRVEMNKRGGGGGGHEKVDVLVLVSF